MPNYDHDVIGVGNSNHPANQTESTTTRKYIVNLDEMSDSFEYDNLPEAVEGFRKALKSVDLEFNNICLDVWTEYGDKPEEVVLSEDASRNFLALKVIISRIKEIKSFPLEPTSDEVQELRSLEESLFSFVE